MVTTNKTLVIPSSELSVYPLSSSISCRQISPRNPQELHFQNSLYEPLLKEFFNNSEQKRAGYLDSQTSLQWWHRLFASQRSKHTLYKQNLLSILAEHYKVIGTLKVPQTMKNLVPSLDEGWKHSLSVALGQG
jgi:hypothetical protein